MPLEVREVENNTVWFMILSLKIKRAVASIVAIVCLVASGWAIERSMNVVYVNGDKFYIHKVSQGETLYSLSKLYEVDQQRIIESNETLSQGEGLKVGSNIKVPYLRILLAPSSRMSNREVRKIYDTHTVAKGETLYSIARKYEISVATIMEDNPALDPSQISQGQKLMIRKTEQGSVDRAQTISELASYTDNLNKIVPQGYKYYIVARGDTLYSLLRNNNMSREEFDQYNNISGDNLNLGDMIILRDNEAQARALAEKLEKERREREGKVLHFVALNSSEELNISLLLPLTASGRVSPAFAEFYRGFLMGLEDLKAKGRSVKVTLFDTQKSKEKIRNIVNNEEFRASNLIVGPVYEELMPAVLKYAEDMSIPVVSPLATTSKINSGALFQMAPAPQNRYAKVGDLLESERQITLISTDKIDTEYETSVKSLIGEREFVNREFVYEHPSAINDRIRWAKRYNREPEPSKGDLSDIIGADSVEHTIFITANNETDVDRILSAITSAEVALRSRSQRVAKYKVMGNAKWNQYTNIDKSMLFQDNVIFFSSYHAKSDNAEVKAFDNRYIKEFGSLPSLYAYRGYDVAKIFGEGMFSDIEYGMEGRTFTPLQTKYRFEKGAESQVRTNQNWVRVNYNSDFTITLE